MPLIPVLTVKTACVIVSVMKSSLTATEFSRIVQKDRKTVVRWIQQRLIPGVRRVGHSYQIPISEVEVFQNSNEYPIKSCQK
ncbi:MAG: helix-turn-helix domain-containing protein [Anaerolineaceae bacterium]|nr:helix-turn-helix domain-containing protein [Anaerolineaceae bacterium]